MGDEKVWVTIPLHRVSLIIFRVECYITNSFCRKENVISTKLIYFSFSETQSEL